MRISKRFTYRNLLRCIFAYKIKINVFLPEILCVVVLVAENQTANFSDLKGFASDVYLSV